MSCKCISDIFRIAETFYYPFSPIPVGFVSCDARNFASLRDSTLDLLDYNVPEKTGSLERTAFVHSSMQQINETLWVL